MAIEAGEKLVNLNDLKAAYDALDGKKINSYSTTTTVSETDIFLKETSGGTTQKIDAYHLGRNLFGFISNQYADVSVASPNMTGVGRCFKFGNIAFVQIRLKVVTSLATSSPIAVIPEGFRPTETRPDITGMYIINGEHNFESQYCTVHTNGNVFQAIASQGLPEGSFLSVDFMYECA